MKQNLRVFIAKLYKNEEKCLELSSDTGKLICRVTIRFESLYKSLTLNNFYREAGLATVLGIWHPCRTVNVQWQT